MPRDELRAETGNPDASAMMSDALSLLADCRIARDFCQTRHATLKTMHNLLRTQVAVGEAADFSPIQLACMAALSDLKQSAFRGKR